MSAEAPRVLTLLLGGLWSTPFSWVLYASLAPAPFRNHSSQQKTKGQHRQWQRGKRLNGRSEVIQVWSGPVATYRQRPDTDAPEHTNVPLADLPALAWSSCWWEAYNLDTAEACASRKGFVHHWQWVT